MTFTSNSEILEIYHGLIACCLPKSSWTHAAHFAAAAAMVSDPLRDAKVDMPGIIRAYNVATGVINDDHGGYHHTITLASLRAVKACIDAAPKDVPLYNIVNAMLADKWGQSDWILEHWSRDRLFSVAARRAWLPPDISPL